MNVSRAEFDQLKAILANCVRNGPERENRENVPFFRDHLAGRVSYMRMIDERRGEKLQRLFEEIA